MKKNVNKSTVAASTQDHLEIADIRDDVVLLKSGGACVIIRTTAVNFGLLSETEQDSIVYAYAGFLNSLSFPIQIIIRSKKMDITSYVELIKEQEKKEMNEAMKIQIQKYREFITSIIQENKVLDKAFYIIIPFSALELGIKSNTTSLLGKKAKKKVAYSNDYILEKAKNALTPKRDNTIRLLSRMGLKAEPLTTTDLIKLFYEIYNPEEEIGQRMVSTQDYQTPLVQPVVDMPMMNQVQAPKPVIQPTIARRPRPQVERQGATQQQPTISQLGRPHSATPSAQGYGGSRATRGGPVRQAQDLQPVSIQQVQSVLSRLQGEVDKMNKR